MDRSRAENSVVRIQFGLESYSKPLSTISIVSLQTVLHLDMDKIDQYIPHISQTQITMSNLNHWDGQQRRRNNSTGTR